MFVSVKQLDLSSQWISKAQGSLFTSINFRSSLEHPDGGPDHSEHLPAADRDDHLDLLVQVGGEGWFCAVRRGRGTLFNKSEYVRSPGISETIITPVRNSAVNVLLIQAL